jgi:AraC family transcriptional regulator, positive regulator of tynA and feaB
MVQRSDFRSSPELDYEGWRDALRPQWGRYSPVAMEPKAFTGRARARSLYGLAAIDLSCNAHRVERTQQDVRLDRVDHYFVFLQVAGGSTIIQNDQAVRLAVGDAVLVDLARPVTYVAEDGCGQWISLQLPRRSLVSHLGFDPRGGARLCSEAPAKRLLFDLVGDADAGDGSAFSPTHSYLQMAVYDLIGALVAPSDPGPVLRQTDKLFARIGGVIKDGFADPDFDPCAVAAKTGISLRYVQKLFTARGSITCCFAIRKGPSSLTILPLGLRISMILYHRVQMPNI